MIKAARRRLQRWREIAAFLRPGNYQQSGAEMGRAATTVMRATIVITNLVGACAVLAVSFLVLPLPTVADTGRVNAAIEAMVREAPSQYLWIHRRFKRQPQGHSDYYDRDRPPSR